VKPSLERSAKESLPYITHIAHTLIEPISSVAADAPVLNGNQLLEGNADMLNQVLGPFRFTMAVHGARGLVR
jgi:hypothetical protein